MEIRDRQNENESLMIQTTARILYNRADTIDITQWIIVLVLPVLKIFFPQNIFLNYFMMIWFLTSFLFDYYIEKYTDSAAEFKKSFDYYVFGWNNDYQEKHVYQAKKYKARKENYFKSQMEHSGSEPPKGVKNWYTTIEKGVSPENAIKAAMRENIYFDQRSNNNAYLLILVLIIGVAISLVMSGLSFYEVLFGLFITFASFTKKLYSTCLNIKKVIAINSNIEDLLCNDQPDLFYIQSEIDKKRTISGTSNKLIYLFKTKKIHKEVSSLNKN